MYMQLDSVYEIILLSLSILKDLTIILIFFSYKVNEKSHHISQNNAF